MKPHTTTIARTSYEYHPDARPTNLGIISETRDGKSWINVVFRGGTTQLEVHDWNDENLAASFEDRDELIRFVNDCLWVKRLINFYSSCIVDGEHYTFYNPLTDEEYEKFTEWSY